MTQLSHLVTFLDPHCGLPFVHRNAVAIAGRPVDKAEFERLDGQPVDPTEPIACGSCGRPAGPPTLQAMLNPAHYQGRDVTEQGITFDQLVAFGLKVCAPSSITNGMPWSFTYRGVPITHENDRCYIVCGPMALVDGLRPNGHFEPGDRLVFDGSMPRVVKAADL